MLSATRFSQLARYRWLAMMLVGSALWILLFECEPTRHSFYPRCMLHEMTGLYCPGCGATRATYQLLHGNLRAALGYNALYVISLPILIYWLAASIVREAGLIQRPRRRMPAWLSRGLFVVVLAFGVVRNIPIKPFSSLAPHNPVAATAALGAKG